MVSKKVAVVGGGQIGQLLSRQLVMDNIDITLFNRPSASAEQIRVNVDKINTLAIDAGKTARVNFVTDLEQVADNDIINYVAGAPRKAGEERSDLYNKNANIVESFLPALVRNNPDAYFVNAANPLDLLTRKMYQVVESMNASNHVIGMGSSLDTKRLHDVIRQELDDANAVIDNAYMLGEHGPSMTLIFSNATVNGKQMQEIFSEDQIAHIAKRTKNRGAEIIRETEHSDVAGPAARLREVSHVLLKGEEAHIPCCLRLINGVFMGQMGKFSNRQVTPFRINMSSAEEVLVNQSMDMLQQQWNEVS